eukprot:FR739806.1.p1 GENE.FR739806.1~~FR739806.1.p1  ORF type:complete len:333 (+),score=38.01 FR739806.1:35-1033(+)
MAALNDENSLMASVDQSTPETDNPRHMENIMNRIGRSQRFGDVGQHHVGMKHGEAISSKLIGKHGYYSHLTGDLKRGSCPVPEDSEHYLGTQYYFGERKTHHDDQLVEPKVTVEEVKAHYRLLCTNFVTVKEFPDVMSGPFRPPKRVAHGHVVQIKARYTVENELKGDREDGMGRDQIYLELSGNEGGFLNAFHPLTGKILCSLVVKEDKLLAKKAADDAWTTVKDSDSALEESTINLCLVYKRASGVEMEIELKTPEGKLGSGPSQTCVDEVPNWSNSLSSPAIVDGRLCHLKNIMSPEYPRGLGPTANTPVTIPGTQNISSARGHKLKSA